MDGGLWKVECGNMDLQYAVPRYPTIGYPTSGLPNLELSDSLNPRFGIHGNND